MTRTFGGIFSIRGPCEGKKINDFDVWMQKVPFSLLNSWTVHFRKAKGSNQPSAGHVNSHGPLAPQQHLALKNIQSTKETCFSWNDEFIGEAIPTVTLSLPVFPQSLPLGFSDDACNGSYDLVNVYVVYFDIYVYELYIFIPFMII